MFCRNELWFCTNGRYISIQSCFDPANPPVASSNNMIHHSWWWSRDWNSHGLGHWFHFGDQVIMLSDLTVCLQMASGFAFKNVHLKRILQNPWWIQDNYSNVQKWWLVNMNCDGILIHSKFFLFAFGSESTPGQNTAESGHLHFVSAGNVLEVATSLARLAQPKTMLVWTPAVCYVVARENYCNLLINLSWDCCIDCCQSSPSSNNADAHQTTSVASHYSPSHSQRRASEHKPEMSHETSQYPWIGFQSILCFTIYIYAILIYHHAVYVHIYISMCLVKPFASFLPGESEHGSWPKSPQYDNQTRATEQTAETKGPNMSKLSNLIAWSSRGFWGFHLQFAHV